MANVVLNPSEVICTKTGSRTSGRKKARSSRANDLYAEELRLKHTPTGIEVHGTLPPGNYSRAEQRRLHEHLYASLYRELEQAVAKARRFPGR